MFLVTATPAQRNDTRNIDAASFLGETAFGGNAHTPAKWPREIAKLTGISESNVGTLLHRLVQTLRAKW